MKSYFTLSESKVIGLAGYKPGELLTPYPGPPPGRSRIPVTSPRRAPSCFGHSGPSPGARPTAFDGTDGIPEDDCRRSCPSS